MPLQHESSGSERRSSARIAETRENAPRSPTQGVDRYQSAAFRVAANGAAPVEQGVGTVRICIPRLVAAVVLLGAIVGSGTGRAGVSAQGGNSYVSSVYGYGLSWDPGVWAVVGSQAEGGLDTLLLGNAALLGVAQFTGNDAFAGDPAACLAAWIAGNLESPAIIDFTLVEGLTLPPALAGEAVGVFTFFNAEVNDGTLQFANYVECVELIPGEATLMVAFSVPLELYDAMRQDFAAVLATLTLPDTAGVGGGDEGEQDDGDDEAGADDGESLGGGGSGVNGNVYTSPSFGYTVTWASGRWSKRFPRTVSIN